MTCRHDERLDDDEWKSGRNEWKREGRNGCVCCVLRVACVCVRADSERWRGEETSGESRSLRSATIVVEHLRESGARREEEERIMWSVVGRSERSGVRMWSVTLLRGVLRV